MIKGKLYVVATPIGNLDDMTKRGIDILKSVSFILAEDTRESRKLLQRYEIETPLVSYRDQNHLRIISKIVEKLDMGLDLALVSDSGTPLISDPGYKLVLYLRENDYEVIPIPGPSAFTSAISASGLPTDKFVFLGFLPKSESKRKSIIEKYGKLDTTLIFYESPKRVQKLLNTIYDTLGDASLFLAKDISKMREQYFFGSVLSVREKLEKSEFFNNPHGEFVCIVKPNISKS
jgi:16S rRNA (cytidine1402-2'-O)-methyltransferase